MNTSHIFDSWKSAFYIRYVEELLASVYSQNNIRCPTHLSIGQEMVPAILSQYLRHSDLAVSSHRSHAHYLSKGGSLSKFFDELHGLKSGCSGGRGGSMHLTDKNVGFIGSTAIVGNTIPIGVGLGNSIKLKSSSDIAIIYLGDGATEEGVFWESIHYSIVANLPCLFVIENNFFSVYTDLVTRQNNTSIYKKLLGFTDNVYLSHDHDFLRFHDTANKAVQLVRASQTAFLLVDTFRYLEHCGPSYDDNLNYRREDFLRHWKSKDILNLLEEYLKDNDYSENIKKEKDRLSHLCDTAYSASLDHRNSILSQFQ
ncbi:thiamine pyrophosphate-dependent enzyme [bacterium]|nr:thiamine pyrophosphate-dependent enzyme [bacterium]